MKTIQLDQGSQEWLSWRRTVITATDCSSILGHNPWTTEYQCWQKKLELVPEQTSNYFMERGKRLEPEARAQFEEKYGIKMIPSVVESTEFEYLGASLDGISELGNYILEIKCGGEKLHEMASRGEIPIYYMDQIQHQLLVTNAEKCFYYSYDGKNGICIEVFPDPAFMENYMPKALNFWRHLSFNEPPPLTDSDYKDMSNEYEWNLYVNEYNQLSEKIKELEIRKEERKKKLIELSQGQSSKGSGIKLIKTYIKGRIDYESIPEIKHVDLNLYRKKGSLCWKIISS